MNENIIPLQSYPTAIEANIAKTKLDAYGIPCFLTDENLAGLYPLNYLPHGNVRLHVFERDKERAMEILEDRSDALEIDRS